jgi:hypothetical protein
MQSIRLRTGDFFWVTRLLAVCWLTTKIISYKLWLTGRLFPVVPVQDWLVAPEWLHLIFFTTSMLALLVLLFRPGFRIAALILLIAESGSCMLDQNRWQPWEYQFLFMLLPLVFIQDEKKIITCWQVILVGLYFFSGLSKLNQKFILQGWNGMILSDWIGYTVENTWISRLGYLLPLTEMFAGIALLFSRTRKKAVVLLAAMHVLILIMFGPAGMNINIVLWPWNLLMPFLVFILFYGKQFCFSIFRQKLFVWWLTVLCWWVLPWLNLFGYWDDFFSGKLYSGKTQYLYICTSNPQTKKIFAAYLAPSRTSAVCDSSISVFNWGIQEMHVPPNPELRIYKKIIHQWQLRYDTSHTDKFMILNPKFAKERWSFISGESE